jgi:hypothetical protein
VRSGPLREHLRKADHRLISFNLLEPARKSAKPQERTRFRAVYYDYTANRAVHAEGDLDDPAKATAEVSAHQPLPSQEEFEAAVEILKADEKLGKALGNGSLVAYEPMPPLVQAQKADGSIERTLTVGLRPTSGKKGLRHEIVGVNMIQRRVLRFHDGAPPTALADTGLCGVPVAAGQATTGKGVAGQVWVEVYQGSTLLWRFLAVRPSASSGHDGSAVELRYVDYRGKRVLYQAHVPVLNVLYDGNKCGPYRDWQFEEGMIKATGTNVGPGFKLCPTPAQTILDTEDDHGNFLGTAIYVDGDEVVLVSEMEAGWYRYVSEWRLHANGTIRPRFGFDATSSSCVCNKHHHHVYWRFDFDIRTPGNNVAFEFNDPPIAPGHHWHRFDYEVKRYRDPGHKRHWRVVHGPSGAGYDILPGANDGTAAGDAYARGDAWFLRWHPNEIDDYPRTAETRIQIDKYLTAESLVRQDIVMWYGAHFTHDVTGPHVDHIVGPSLVPHEW